MAALAEKLRTPTKKLLFTLGIKAVYSIFISIFLMFLLVFGISYYLNVQVLLFDTNFYTLIAFIYIFTLIFTSINILMEYYTLSMEEIVRIFGTNKIQSILNKEYVFQLTLYQIRSLSNFLKWLSIGLLASGTMSGILLIQQSTLGLTTENTLLGLFIIQYFIGFLIVAFRRLLMSNADWIIVNLEDFVSMGKGDCLKKALLSYNKWLGSCLSLKKLLVISHYVSQAYKLSTSDQKNVLNEDIKKICKDVQEKNIPAVDAGFIRLTQKAKDMVKDHNAILGMSVKYPLKNMLWEQTKLSLAKNYSKLMYLFLGIILLVVLKQLNLMPATLP
jgi:hypothetical protein